MAMIPISIVKAAVSAIATISPGTQMRADIDAGMTRFGLSASPRIAGADPPVFASR